MMEAEVLRSGKDELAYERFLKTQEHSSLFQSLKYRELLKLVTGGEDCYLILKEDARVIGAFPAFLKINSKYGNVLNSLPFYGSNGGVLADGRQKKHLLLSKFNKLAEEKGAILSTIITKPFEADFYIYDRDYIDFRIGQVTTLPDSKDWLMPLFHKKTRNMVRKAYKEGIGSRWATDADSLEFLRALHTENMGRTRANPKGKEFFEAVPKIFDPGPEYRIYVAELKNERVAALLLFYYNRTVEYFVPAVLPEYRNLQPSSLLIYEAMRDAVDNGFKYWNWGGTSKNQENVYHFKKHWGTGNRYYYYFTKKHGDCSRIEPLNKERLLEEYPYFYTMPFDCLKERGP